MRSLASRSSCFATRMIHWRFDANKLPGDVRLDHQPEEEYNLSRQNRPDTFSSWVIEDSYVSKTWVIESNPMFEGSLSSVRVAIYMRFVHANDYSLGL